MKKEYLHTALLVLLGVFTLQAQQDSAHILREVTVVDSRFRALQIGQFQYKTDSIKLLISPAASMAEWLQNASSVHVRQYAPGSAASFSTRGATSAQSAVLWSGFVLNSAATGVSDLSLLPANLFAPTLLLGGSATFFGSGAIGGVLNLAEDNQQKKGWHGSFGQQVASFKTFKTSLAATYSGLKFCSKTTFTSDKSANNFAYTNLYTLPATTEKRQHAAYKQFHVNQFVDFKLNKWQKVEAEVWYNKAERQTPNSILVNKPAVALLNDTYLRSRLNWLFTKEKTKINVAYAFLYEWQTYQDSTQTNMYGEELFDTNITASHVFQANQQTQIGQYLQWQNGLQVRLDKVSGSNRSGSQNTISAQSGLFFAKKWLSAQAVLRAELWNEKLLPLSPFASLRAEFLKNVFASIYGGYNYRIPSLNDRFWVPGGNLNLEPESGWNGEVAVFYNQKTVSKNVLIRLAAYKNTMQNYIQWVPGAAGIWAPHNVKVVSISGIDFNANVAQTIKKWFFSGELNASFNDAFVQESSVPGDQSQGQQLIYQPKYKATFGATAGYFGWFCHTDYLYTGSVTTSYDGSTQDLEAFTVVDVSVSKSFHLKKTLLNFIFAVNNVANQGYQTIPFFPMPGRNFSLTLKISI